MATATATSEQQCADGSGKGVKHNQTAKYWCWQQLLPLSKPRQASQLTATRLSASCDKPISKPRQAYQQAVTAMALGQLCFSVEYDSLVPPAGQAKFQQCNI